MIIQFPIQPGHPVPKREHTVPDPTDQRLENLLAYPEPREKDDRFVVDVMRQVRKERRTRKAILAAFGGIGAVFGIAGAVLLSDGIGQVFTQVIPAMTLTQVPLFAVGVIAFYLWFMNDDLALGS